MAEIDRDAFDRYVRQSRIAEKLAEDERLGKQLEAAAKAMLDAPDEAARRAPRERIVRLVFGMCETSAGVANGAADGFFEKSTGKRAADHARRVTIEQAEGQVRYTADRMFESGDASEFASRMQRWTALKARGFSNDAMYDNVTAARKAGVDMRYAHVPTTSAPCTFCCEMASYGFRFKNRSKKELHHGCKCRLVPGFEGDMLRGYDPEGYRKSIALDESGLTVEIDEMTPCLRRLEDGEIVKTSFKRVHPKKGEYRNWEFDWSKPEREGSDVFALLADGDDRVQGLLAMRDWPENQAVYVDLVESAPFNNAHSPSVDGKEYSGVGAHLFAEAVKKSYELGYNGFIAFDAKSGLLEHYEKMLGAIRMGGSQRMYVDERGARILYERYYGLKP